jgi:hypothetical protein
VLGVGAPGVELDPGAKPTILKSSCPLLPLTEITVALMLTMAPRLSVPVQVSDAPTLASRPLGQLTLTRLFGIAANFGFSAALALDSTSDALILLDPHAETPTEATAITATTARLRREPFTLASSIEACETETELPPSP